ncbi:MAG: TIGR02285 family protein [Pseudomonadota bacterium]
MKHAQLLIASFLIGSSAPAGAQTSQREGIMWVSSDFRPYTIAEGPDKGQGIIDKAIAILVKRLPGVDYEYTSAANLRIFELMKARPGVCAGFLLKTTEREQFADFTSNAVLKVLPNGIITTRDRYAALRPYLNESGELRLDAMLADGKHRLAIGKTRSFGPRMDSVLATPAFQNSVVRFEEASMSSRFMKLLTQKEQAEYDMVIGYPIELKPSLTESRFNGKDFSFIPIAGEAALVSIPISCSKSVFGKQYTAAIDKILAEPGFQQEISQLYRRWLDGETAVRYEKLLKQASAAR